MTPVVVLTGDGSGSGSAYLCARDWSSGQVVPALGGAAAVHRTGSCGEMKEALLYCPFLVLRCKNYAPLQ